MSSSSMASASRFGGQFAAEVLFSHRRRAGKQVPKVVGKVGIDAADQGFVGKVAVRAEGDLRRRK